MTVLKHKQGTAIVKHTFVYVLIALKGQCSELDLLDQDLFYSLGSPFFSLYSGRLSRQKQTKWLAGKCSRLSRQKQNEWLAGKCSRLSRQKQNEWFAGKCNRLSRQKQTEWLAGKCSRQRPADPCFTSTVR